MKNIKYFLGSLFILVLSFVGQVIHADGEVIRLIVKNNGNVVYSDNLNLPAAGMVGVNDSDGAPHDVEARSVLNMVSIADAASSSFNISNLIYYSSFSAFYLKCITVESELCDNWQYKVNDVDPGIGMDSSVLSGGENVVLFFGDENPAPAPAVIRQAGSAFLIASSGGGGGGGSLAPAVSVPLTTTPALEQSVFAEIKTEPAPQIIESPKEVAPPIEIKKVEKKTIEKKKIAKKKVQNTASVISSVETKKDIETPAPVVKKKSWFRRLFGF
ncbi:MAG: hypothetical protein WC783_02795 [Candidatus Paceibacterota bacterium]|jgi:hypothetical protein